MANKFAKNDEAVSAVIGVILMVAITVILAAVIAAFVFGMGSSIKKTYVVSFTIDRSTTAPGTIIVTNNGGPDVGKLTKVEVTTTTGTAPSGSYTTDIINVGHMASITGATATAHVIVTGTFNDGTTQVLATGDY